MEETTLNQVIYGMSITSRWFNEHKRKFTMDDLETVVDSIDSLITILEKETASERYGKVYIPSVKPIGHDKHSKAN